MAGNIEILKDQEEKLQFEKFDQEEAWKLGCYMVDYAKKHKIVIALSIRLNSGCTIFQYCPPGTNLLNHIWMDRKFNTVRLTEHSSLYTAVEWEKEQQTAALHGLEEKEYAICGGGFPIRVKGTQNILGAIIASNLYHIADHEFVVNCLKEYLHCSDAADYPYVMP